MSFIDAGIISRGSSTRHSRQPIPTTSPGDAGRADTLVLFDATDELARSGSIPLTAGLCFVLGLIQGAEWADAIRAVPEHELGDGMCWMCHGLGTAAAVLWLGGLLISLVPAAIIGHSPSPWRRVGLAGLISAVTAATLIGFALNTGIGGRLGFPEAGIPFGVVGVLVSVSIGAGFGFEVGSVIRRRGKERRLPTSERSILIVMGVVVLVIAVFMLLALIDAILFA